MLYHLRVTVTVFCTLACALLLALWVRSFNKSDLLKGHLPGVPQLVVVSDSGKMLVAVHGQEMGNPQALPWRIFHSAPTDSLPKGNALGFLITRPRSGPKILVPQLFMVFLAGILSAAPWIRWSWRFRLRTLLVATTLVAVLLGTLVISN